MNFQLPIESLKGVGEKTAEKLKKCAIYTIEDLLLYFPRDYEIINGTLNSNSNSLKEKVIIRCRAIGIERDIRTKNNKIITTIVFSDGEKTIKGKWFNQPFIKKNFTLGEEYRLLGKVENFKRDIYIANPKIVREEIEENKTVILPKYPLKEGVTNTLFIKLINTALESVKIKESLPNSLIEKYSLVSFEKAIKSIHNPKDEEELREARKRLKFGELLTYSLKILLLKDYNSKLKKGVQFSISDRLKELKESIPFELTAAQKKVVKEILLEQKSNKVMNRLVQGDVGSGKTIVAIIAMFNVVMNGYQTAMMVPTEILAKQHFEEVKKLLESFNINIELLVGSISNKEKLKIKENLKEGKIDIVIGTHALLEEDVQFLKLGLIITDEQHRFGVMQRTKLINKGENIETLVMSATPIPRTLTLCLYGDLELSIINELPPNRKKIQTYYIEEKEKERAYKFALNQIEAGRQVYIVCPLIEENEELNLNSVELLYEELKNNYLKEKKAKILHGRMSAKEKEEVMKEFKEGKLDVLIATTVIEVGVNVPNATLMIIENAERFGLAQLHQLRGRVGRGSHESYCILIANIKNEVTKRRMEVMKKSSDGFLIAEEDLKIRGAGEVFGFNQHGEEGLLIAKVMDDYIIFKAANEEAKNILNSEEEECLSIKKDILKKIEYTSKFISFN